MSTAVWAHRGARAQAAENTLAAFSLALRLGADGVELDVHRTADGGLVVHHDARAEALGVLAELPEAEIRERRPDIPTLVEVLDCCVGSLVNVEIKNLPTEEDYDETEQAAAAVVALLAARGRSDDVVISSFNPQTLLRVRELDPEIPTGLLTFTDDVLGALVDCVADGHGALHPWGHFVGGDVAHELVAAATERGVAVNVWTVNDESDLERLARAGVSALITDLPDVARRIVDSLRG